MIFFFKQENRSLDSRTGGLVLFVSVILYCTTVKATVLLFLKTLLYYCLAERTVSRVDFQRA